MSGFINAEENNPNSLSLASWLIASEKKNRTCGADRAKP